MGELRALWCMIMSVIRHNVCESLTSVWYMSFELRTKVGEWLGTVLSSYCRMLLANYALDCQTRMNGTMDAK
jgi:hypothetical protein